MPCHAATNDKSLTVTPDQEVDEVLALMKKEGLEYVPVVDEDKKLQGLFSYQTLFKNLVPVSVAMADGVQMDVTVGAAPGVAKRLKKVGPLPVKDFMSTKPRFVHPETPTWEGISMLVQSPEPLMVIEAETGKFIGTMDGHSAMAELERLKDTES